MFVCLQAEEERRVPPGHGRGPVSPSKTCNPLRPVQNSDPVTELFLEEYFQRKQREEIVKLQQLKAFDLSLLILFVKYKRDG